MSACNRPFGAFIAVRRIKRQMTQRQYAEWVGISLRSLISAEQLVDKPWNASGILLTWSRREFGDATRMHSSANTWMISDPKSARSDNALACWFDVASRWDLRLGVAVQS